MNYIIVDGHVVGIANNNYNELSAHPSINNTILDIAKNYSSEDLNIIKVCSKAEYDAMASHNPNTVYYVYTDIPFPTVDSINYLDVANKPSINNIILTGNKSLKSLNIYSIDEVDNMMASMRSIKVVPTKPAIADVVANTLYYVGTAAPYQVYLYDSNKTEARLGTSEVDLSAYVKKDDIATTIDSSSTNNEVAGAKSVYDYSAPVNSVLAFANNIIAKVPNDAVFNMRGNYESGVVVEQRTDQNGSITDPVSGNLAYGRMTTIQRAVTGSTVRIRQDIEVFGDGNNTKCFRRYGKYNGSGTVLYENRANINWGDWIPIEYPRIQVGLDTSVMNGGYVDIAISGGTATIRFNAVRAINSATSQSAIRIDSNATNLAFMGNNKFKPATSGGYIWGVATNVDSKNILICMSGGNSPHLYVWNVEAGVQYYGEIVVPLGY